MIEINLTLFVQMANFLVLLFLMNLVLYRPIRRMVADRNQLVSEQQAGIERADAAAVAAVQEFSARIQDARKKGREKIQELKAAAYENEKELLHSAAEEAAALIKQMRAQIGKDTNVARRQLKAQVKAFSKDLAQKILGRSL
jgi:F-type H+-transporting ATPase subunit b